MIRNGKSTALPKTAWHSWFGNKTALPGIYIFVTKYIVNSQDIQSNAINQSTNHTRSIVLFKTCKQPWISSRQRKRNVLQHRLQVISNLERSLCLGLDLVNSNTVSKLNQSQTVGEVDVKDAKVGNDTADAGLAGQGEFAVLDDLGVALLVGVLHGHDNLGGGGVGDEIHGTAKALDLAGEHP